MDSGEETLHWSVFDSVKSIPATPQALMAEINSAISALEYSRATRLLQSPFPLGSRVASNRNSASEYDTGMADEAYKAGLAAMAAGKFDDAVDSLNAALSKCPPEKISAVAKLQSLISLTSQQRQKSSN